MFVDHQNPMSLPGQRAGVRFGSVAGAIGRLRFRARSSANDLDCWVYQPLIRDLTAAPVIAVHGIRRKAHEQAELLAERARQQGRVVIAPIFDRERWPQYQKAVIRGRADKALMRLWHELRGEGIVHSDRFILSGFSGGAQFAHRFAMLNPHMVERLIVGSAGWYTFPDLARFPYGMTSPPRRHAMDGLKANLPEFLRIPITVAVGSRDNRRDANTRQGAQIDAQQGMNRLERAQNWAEAMRCRARTMGIPHRIETVILDRCRHNFRRCVLRGGLDRLILPDGIHASPAIKQEREATGRDEALVA